MNYLKEISLRYNPISEKEVERLRQLLPNVIIHR
jgi:hypothetical protein